MTPAEYGFAVGAGLQQGFSNVLMGLREARAQQDQSLRERAFVEEMRQNNLLFPLKQAQIENQTQAVKLQSEMQRYNLNLQNAQMGMLSAMAPIETEMSFLSEADPVKLSSYQIPDIKVDHPDPTFAKYASDLARQKLLERKTSLLEATEDFQDRKATADTLRQAARLPGIEAPIKAQLRTAAAKLRSGGYGSLSDFEIQSLIPLAEKKVFQSSKEYRDIVKGEREYALKATGEETKRMAALAKVTEGLFTPEETRAAAGKGISEILGGTKIEPLKPNEKVEKAATEEIDLEPVRLKMRQGAEVIRQGADPMQVIERLVPEVIKAKRLPDNPKTRAAVRLSILQRYQAGGLNLPNLYSEDFEAGQEEE